MVKKGGESLDNQHTAELLLYNRLVDDLMFLGNNAILRMNALLYSNAKGANNRRDYYYRETQYVDKNGLLVRKVNRFIDSFLTIENLKLVGHDKEYIVIRGRDLELMRIFLLPKLESIVQNFGDVFQVRGGHLYVNEKIKPIEVEVGSREKILWFKPGAHKLYNDEVVPAMELYLNSPTNMSVMSFPCVYGLMYIIRTFQIHTYASSMLAFLGHPPMGLNLYDMSLNQEVNSLSGYKYEEPEQLKLKRQTGGFFGKEIRRRNEEKGDG